jgi:hypothetical protein
MEIGGKVGHQFICQNSSIFWLCIIAHRVLNYQPISVMEMSFVYFSSEQVDTALAEG